MLRMIKREADGQWWFRDTELVGLVDDGAPHGDAVGPYETRAAAEDDRRGLQRFYEALQNEGTRHDTTAGR